jgi:hypothetical protein
MSQLKDPSISFICFNATDEDIPRGAVVSIIPDQPYYPANADPVPARNEPLVGQIYLEVRIPTEEDENAQNPEMTAIAVNGLNRYSYGICEYATRSSAILMSSLVGETEEDTVTEEQYQGIPLGICKDSYYLHRGGCIFRLFDWSFSTGNEGVAYSEVHKGYDTCWFKTENEIFSSVGSASDGILSSALVDIYYMGKDSGSNETTLIPSDTLEEDTPIKVRAYHMGSSIPAGSYGQLSRVGGRWCVSAVYC